MLPLPPLRRRLSQDLQPFVEPVHQPCCGLAVVVARCRHGRGRECWCRCELEIEVEVGVASLDGLAIIDLGG
jgi:hypothetical protein